MAEGFGPSEPGRFWRSLAARFRSAPEIYGLALAIVVFFGASFALSWLRALEFQTTTWDLGILQQALWSTAHGRPFYESADLETGGYQSLLQIHSAFLLYLLVPVYAAWPYPTTLFAVQSAVVASAAIPLFLLGRHVTGSPRLGLVAALAFLGWMPTLASTLYDVHIEALLPLETFSFTYLWARGRYGWGFAVGFVAFLSMELAPVLLFFVGLFFLLPARLELDRLRERFRRAIADPKVLAGVGFLVSCVAAYASLLYLREHYLIQALGFHSLSTGGSGYVIGATPVELGLRASNLSIGFGTKMTNWILLLALLGFVPLLAPRALVLALPWVTFTFFTSDLNYIAFGFQYGFISGGALLIAFVYGLTTVRRWLRKLEASDSRPPGESSRPETGPPRPFRRPIRWMSLRTAAYGSFALLIVLNLALTPADPLLENGFTGAAYRISYEVPPGYDEVQNLVSLVPPGATIIATDNLFPLVANDLNAYSFLWTADPSLYLPFDATHVPSYVLIAENRTGAVSPWFLPLLYNSSVYGVRGIVWSSIAGSVILFQNGYSGPSRSFGAIPVVTTPYYGSALATGGPGYVAPLAGSPYPEGIAAFAGTTGPLWLGPNAALPAGNYTVTLGLRAHSTDPSRPTPSDTPALGVGAWAFGFSALYYRAYSFSALESPGFLTIQFSFSLPAPVMEFEVEGTILEPSVAVDLEFMQISPGP